MSATLQSTGEATPAPRRRRHSAAAAPGSAGSWVAFGALALYGALRWATMLGSSGQGRLIASLVVAVALAAVTRRLLATGARIEIALATILALVVLIALAGFQVSLHIGRFADALGSGISTMNGLLVPYTGSDPNTGPTLVLGGSGLLLLGGLSFGCARRPPATLALGLTAVPLLALAVVPSVIVQPHLVYFHGIVAGVLVACLMLGPRVRPERRVVAGVLLGTAAVVGAIAAGVIAGDGSWLSVAGDHPAGGRGTASTADFGLAEQFDWQQTYGTQGWPYTGETVATIQAARVAYWKTEDLDLFNGSGWTSNNGSTDDALQGVDPANIATYSETLTVHLAQIYSNQIIAAGYADPPRLFGATPGFDPGTWVTNPPLGPGESYRVRAYVPDPPASALAAAGTDYPAAIAPFTQFSAKPSVYSGVEALAKRLGNGANSPYDVVQSVLSYLQHGYVYTLDPPNGGAYPLVDFLLHSKRGYCQQFAGAMALLLRMDGVPARVAVGFSPGENKKGTHGYVIADEDAHAWVEVFFPGYGWVTVDPTPGRATTGGAVPAAAAGTTSTPTTSLSTTTPTNTGTTRAQTGADRLAGRQNAGSAGGLGSRHGDAGTDWLTAAAVVLALVLLAIVTLLLRSLRRRPTTRELTDELERAFASCGRPLGDEVTLAGLQRTLRDSPGAAAYVAALGAVRFDRRGGGPTAAGRAALRRWLGHGLGIGGRVRALRALPPRRAGQLTSP